jgi:hypothetical protein
VYSDLRSELIACTSFHGITQCWQFFESDTAEGWQWTTLRLERVDELAGILTLAPKGGKPSGQSRQKPTIRLFWN